MKGRAIDQLVFETMFRCPKAGDPTNFHHFLQMHLVSYSSVNYRSPAILVLSDVTNIHLDAQRHQWL